MVKIREFLSRSLALVTLLSFFSYQAVHSTVKHKRPPRIEKLTDPNAILGCVGMVGKINDILPQLEMQMKQLNEVLSELFVRMGRLNDNSQMPAYALEYKEYEECCDRACCLTRCLQEGFALLQSLFKGLEQVTGVHASISGVPASISSQQGVNCLELRVRSDALEVKFKSYHQQLNMALAYKRIHYGNLCALNDLSLCILTIHRLGSDFLCHAGCLPAMQDCNREKVEVLSVRAREIHDLACRLKLLEQQPEIRVILNSDWKLRIANSFKIFLVVHAYMKLNAARFVAALT